MYLKSLLKYIVIIFILFSFGCKPAPSKEEGLTSKSLKKLIQQYDATSQKYQEKLEADPA